MLFQIDEKGGLKAVQSDWSPKELDIESYLVTTNIGDAAVLPSSVFGEEMLVIDNQVRTRKNKRADIVALDRGGNGVVVELKRGVGRLGVETQALQYLADLAQYSGAAFITRFGGKSGDLGNTIRSYVGGEVEIDAVNSSQRVILVARSFDETLFSMGEWLSSKGVGFRCIEYDPVEIGHERFISFSVAFDRSEASTYGPRFGRVFRKPGYFWHNIAHSDQQWWDYLVTQGQLPACFENRHDDQGASIMTRYVDGDKIVAFAKGRGAVGWGTIRNANSYRIVAAGSPDDRLSGDCRHRIEIQWNAVASQLSDAVSAETVRNEFGIFHPISTSVSMDAERGARLTEHLSKVFGPTK